MIESTVAAGKPEPDFAQIAGCTVVSFRYATQVTTQVTGQVTGEVKKLLGILEEVSRSRVEAQSALQLQIQANCRDRYLLPALEAVLIERTIPDKPSSRLQKYRLTSMVAPWIVPCSQASRTTTEGLMRLQ